jgi:hypothetical protein
VADGTRCDVLGRSHAISHAAGSSRSMRCHRNGCDLQLSWWGYVDLNHGPLPYQGLLGDFITCRIPGRRWKGMSVVDRETPSEAARSGTLRARASSPRASGSPNSMAFEPGRSRFTHVTDSTKSWPVGLASTSNVGR